MELVYIWVSNYGCFKDSGFNLNSKHYFEFDNNNKVINYVYQKDKIEYFFDNEKNIDVVAVVGNNGSGKTTFLELLFRSLLNGEVGVKTDILYMFRSSDDCKFSLYYCPASGISTVIRLDTIKENLEYFYLENGIILNNISENDIKNQGKKNLFINAAKDIHFIYLSSTFDNRYYSNEKIGNISDLSTISLIKSNAKMERELKFLHPIMDINIEYFYHEFSNQIDFITSYKNFERFLPFNLPEKSYVKLCNIDYLQESVFKLIDDYTITDKLNDILKHNNAEAVKNIVYFKNEVIKRILILLLNDYCSEPSTRKRGLYPEIISVIKKAKINNSPWETIKTLIFSIKEQLKQNNIPSEIFTNSYIEFIEWLETNVSRIGNFDYIQIDNTFIIPTKKSEDFVGIQEFFENYRHTASIIEYLNFSWGLSTGESTLLSLFSRLFTLCEKQNDKYYLVHNEKKQNNAIFLIDEADLTFHPEWQQKYIQLLIAYIKDIYNNCSVKIVIATHSPIILSDIPKQNVIFLRNIDGVTRVEKNQNHSETFAANIATLFYDSFFMEKGSIGEFARQKINQIIAVLKPTNTKTNLNCKYPDVLGILKELSLSDINELDNLINTIGEPIIREKLFDMWDMCVYNGTSKTCQIQRLESRISRYEKTLNQLKGIKKNDTH